MPRVFLLLSGCALLVLYRLGLRADEAGDIRWFMKIAFAQSAIYLVAVWLVLRIRSSNSTVILAVALAVLFRLSILFAPPYLSDDLYRYVWDGRVQAAGINPYRYVPAAPELAHLRDETIYPKINRRDFAPTIYPPVAQALFFLTTRISETVTWMKVTMLGFELLAVWAIAQLLTSLGLPLQRLLIYAWHPLIVWEFAGSGHVDAIAIAFIVLAFLARNRKAQALAGCALACATLVKLFPLLLFPFVYRRWSWKMPLAFTLTIIFAYLPYLSVGPQRLLGYLPGYAQEQGLVNGAQFYLLSLARKVFGPELPVLAFIIFAVLIIAAIAVWAFLRDTENHDGLKRAIIPTTATTVLFAPHYSWYFAWLVPFLCLRPYVAVFYLSVASLALYATWLGDSAEQMFRLNSLIYLPFFLITVIELGHKQAQEAQKVKEI